MRNPLHRLTRRLFGTLANPHYRPRHGGPRDSRRTFLNSAAKLLGLGCVAAPACLEAAETSSGEEPSVARRWEELSATALAEVLEETSLAYVPIGTLEFHGPHLPLGTDAIHAHEFCLAAARRTGGVVLPPTWWSPHGHEGWVGSLLIREETFRLLVNDVFTLLARQGVEWIVACTGHYPAKQEPAIQKIAEGVVEQFPKTRILVLGPWCHPTDPTADHGGNKETSLMLALRPHLVHKDRLGGKETMRGIAASAVEGTPEFGHAYFGSEVENFVEQLNEARRAGENGQ